MMLPSSHGSNNQNVNMRVLIAPDKFKGTITADRAAALIAEGWRKARPLDTCQCLPISDGGEGFLSAMTEHKDADWQATIVTGPSGKNLPATWASSQGKAFIEASKACGLNLLAANERNPMQTTSRGLGELLLAAAAGGAREILVGLGGSGTNDGGLGMAMALGYRFLDAAGHDLPSGPEWLLGLEKIIPPPDLVLPRTTVGCDVQNPLLGIDGCSRVFGPQKGLTESNVDLAEKCLTRLAEVVQQDLGLGEASRPGSGAAGGLGFGLVVFCGARLVSGFELVASARGLRQKIAEADIIITGEGSLDQQSLGGKAPVALAKMAMELGKPSLCLAGKISSEIAPGELFEKSLSLVECAGSADAALAEPERWLKTAAMRLAESW
jgi:glycerate kinase